MNVQKYNSKNHDLASPFVKIIFYIIFFYKVIISVLSRIECFVNRLKMVVYSVKNIFLNVK